MKAALTSVDVCVLAEELDKKLKNSRIENIHQVSDEEFVFGLYKKEKIELAAAPNFACITNYKRSIPREATNLVMQLRKHLRGCFIRKIIQHDFDRVIEIEISGKGDYTLIIELFSKGNLILLRNEKIIWILKSQKWRDRTLRPGMAYEYPPAVLNPLTIGDKDFLKIIKNSGKSIVKTLAMDFSLGGLYAEELCLDAKIEKEKNANELTEKELAAVQNSFFNLIKKIKSESIPQIIFENKRQVDVIPFELQFYKNSESKKFDSFNEAVDEYFSNVEIARVDETAETSKSKAIERLEKQLEIQRKTLEELKEKSAEYRSAGDTIYQNMHKIQTTIDEIKKLRQEGLTDSEIREKLKLKSLDKYELVVEI